MQSDKTPKNLTTRVFRAGNSLAVRIPKAFELAEGEVVIEQREGGLFINTRRGNWSAFLEALEPEEWDGSQLRDDAPARSVDDSWLS